MRATHSLFHSPSSNWNEKLRNLCPDGRPRRSTQNNTVIRDIFNLNTLAGEQKLRLSAGRNFLRVGVSAVLHTCT